MAEDVALRSKALWRFRLPEPVLGFLLVLPAVSLLAALTMYPVLYGVWISLFNKHSFFPEQTFIGLGNYVAILGDAEFWASVQRGAIYAVSTIVLQIVLGVAVAVLLDQRFPGRNILRAIVIFPYIVPTVVAVILWKWLLNSQFGLVNYLIESAGLSNQPIRTRLDHDFLDPGQRMAIFPVRGDRGAGPLANNPGRALRSSDR